METGIVSQTALSVAAVMLTLNQQRGWSERLPAGLADLTEQLLLAADVYPFTARAIRLSKRRSAVRMARLSELAQPGTFMGLGKRKIFMNEQVEQAIEEGATQVIVVGAGFDTLSLRLAPVYPDVQFLELDHPATSAAKARGVARVGQPPNMQQIAVDLAETPLSQALAECSAWRPGQRCVVVAEGLLYYLPPAAVHKLFAEVLAATASGSRVAFSHLTDLRRHAAARVMLRLFGEPWLSASSVKRLGDYLGPGWQVLSTAAGRGYRDLEGFAVAEST